MVRLKKKNQRNSIHQIQDGGNPGGVGEGDVIRRTHGNIRV